MQWCPGQNLPCISVSLAQLAILHGMVAVQHVFDTEATLSHVVQQAGRNPSKVVALQLATHVWH